MADLHLVQKGMREPRAGLLEEGKVHVQLGREHAASLAKFGWPKAQTDTLEQEVKALEAGVTDQALARDESKRATMSQAAALANAKAFKRRLDAALPLVLRASDEVDATVFEAGGPIGRNVARLSAWLARIRGPLGRIDASLQRYLGGESALKTLDEVKADLDAADAEQETKLSALPAETLAVYERKGRVLQLIEDMNRIARIAFDGQAEVRARFNKDVLLRARRSRPARPATVAAAS